MIRQCNHDVQHSSRHHRATDAEMKFYFDQLAPEMEWHKARIKFWRSMDVFGKEGSLEKEHGIKNRILKSSE